MRTLVPILTAAALAAACSDMPSRLISLPPYTRPVLAIGADGNPVPAPSDRILVDTRTSLQQVTTLSDVWALFPGNDHSGASATDGTGWAFTTNFDGNGTHALRADWQSDPSCSGNTVRVITYFPAPLPTQVFIQWRQYLGKGSNDGSALGAAGSFRVVNPACPDQGRQDLRVLRGGVGGGGSYEIDNTWAPSVTAAADANIMFGSTELDGTQGWEFDPEQNTGRPVTITVYMQAASTSSANDGVIQVWIDGKLYISRTKLSLATYAFDRFELPSMFGGPPQDESEYFWDVVAWQPSVTSSAVSVAVTPATATLAVGGSVQLSETTDSAGLALSTPVTWMSVDTSVAKVNSSGVVTAVAAGTDTITATSDGASGSAVITVSAPPPPSPAPVASVSVTVGATTLAVGQTTTATATLKDSAGNVLTGQSITWTSSNPAIASVAAAGPSTATVTAVAGGSANISATADGVTGTSTVSVSNPPPPPSGTPAPGTGATIILDTRQTLQRATTIDEAFGIFGIVDHTPYRGARNTSGWSFAQNADGNGLHALRADWEASTSTDQGIRVIDYLPEPKPTEVYIQWKARVSGFPTDPDANGTPNSYAVYPQSDACKRALISQVSNNRIDYTLHRSVPEVAKLEVDAYNYAFYSDANIWNFNEEVAQPPYTTTIYLKVATSNGANNGIYRLWINGTLLIDRSDVPADASAIDRWEFPATCTVVPQPQADYFWDFLVWKP